MVSRVFNRSHLHKVNLQNWSLQDHVLFRGPDSRDFPNLIKFPSVLFLGS